MSQESTINRAGDECYWCGGGLAESGSIKVQMREGEPKRETCPGCLREWTEGNPPDEVREKYMDGENQQMAASRE